MEKQREEIYSNYFINPYLRGLSFYIAEEEREIKEIQTLGDGYYSQNIFFNGTVIFHLTEKGLEELEEFALKVLTETNTDTSLEVIRKDGLVLQAECLNALKVLADKTSSNKKQLFAVNLSNNRIQTYLEEADAFIPALDLDIFNSKLVNEVIEDFYIENTEREKVPMLDALDLIKSSVSDFRTNVIINPNQIVFKVSK